MRRFGLWLFIVGGFLLLATPGMAQQKSLIETVAKGCKAEIEKYCGNVAEKESH